MVQQRGKTKMNKWDERFLRMAALVGTWSKDPSTSVGAVITDKRHRVLSVGFNGLPRGIKDDKKLLGHRENKYKTIIHAEENALFFANAPVRGCTIYVWPMPPCSSCCSKLIQCEIARVVSFIPDQEKQRRWGDSFQLAVKMFEEAGIILDLYEQF